MVLQAQRHPAGRDRHARRGQRLLGHARSGRREPRRADLGADRPGRRDGKRISKNWVVAHTAGHVVAVTLETAWNTPHSTTAGYQTVGRQLGLAVELYLRTSPRQPSAEAAGD